MKYSYVILSDLHIGSAMADLSLLEKFLSELYSAGVDTLILNGDIFDLWVCSDFGNPEYKTVLKLLNQFPKIVYIYGNHDNIPELISVTWGFIYSRYTIPPDIYITHGDEYDNQFKQPSLFMKSIYVNVHYLHKIFGNLYKWLYEKLNNFYYSSWMHYDDNVFLPCGTKCNKVLLGHTHVPHEYQREGFTVFNLGSWVTTPYGYFIEKENPGKQSFHHITKDNLLPPGN